MIFWGYFQQIFGWGAKNKKNGQKHHLNVYVAYLDLFLVHLKTLICICVMNNVAFTLKKVCTNDLKVCEKF